MSVGELVLEDVSVGFGKTPVLRGVSIRVSPGEIVGLLGPNGVGKTTLLRVAAGQLSPDEGSARLDGRSLAGWPARELARRLAVVPQDLHVPFPFSAGELVLMGRSPHQSLLSLESEDDVEVALRAMEQLSVEHLADRRIDELSGGERQLVLLARALAQEAPLLLLDEPTSFLDLRHRLEVLAVVNERVRRGSAALVVSHDLSLAARTCDRLVVLAGGEVAAEGPPADVVSPELVARVYGVSADIVSGPDGAPLVAPHFPAALPEGGGADAGALSSSRPPHDEEKTR